MTKEQIDILNESIINIQTVCKMHIGCMDCPMKSNCNEFPTNWDTVDYKEANNEDHD